MDTTQERFVQTLKEVILKKEKDGTSPQFENMLAVSFFLNNHPALDEDLSYKNKYLSVLEYFVNNYAKDSMFALAALDVYKSVLLGNNVSSYTYACKDINSQAKWIARTRFRSFKLFSNRFILAMDLAFLCSFGNSYKAHTIFNQLKSIYHARYRDALESLYSVLYMEEDPTPKLRVVYPQLNTWIENINYLKKSKSVVLFAANMSAGKSTLINAIIGKKVNRSLNQACTAKLHYIYSKASEDSFTYEYDHILDLNADYETLMEDNASNCSNKISVGTAFKFLAPTDKRICFIDTPGANFSRDSTHREIAYEAIRDAEYNTLVYAFAAGSTGITDEFEYLSYIKRNCRHGCRLVFVLNKLDEYNESEDSIDVSLGKVDADLKKIGFTDYELYPVSGYAGYLAKRSISGEQYAPNTPDFFDYMRCKARFNTPNFDFTRYYNIPANVVDFVKNSLSYDLEDFELLQKSGMLGLEYALTR